MAKLNDEMSVNLESELAPHQLVHEMTTVTHETVRIYDKTALNCHLLQHVKFGCKIKRYRYN